MFENTLFLSIFGFFIVLTPLVFIHELGHYYAAKKNGVIVEQFSVGFGPEIFGFNDKHNTRWKFCIVPFGGYVKMRGELLVKAKKSKNAELENGSFNNASLLARFIIVFAGPLANLIFGILIFSFLYSVNGRYETQPIIDKVIENSPAEKGGLKSNDLILSINKKKVYTFNDIKPLVGKDTNLKSFEVLRNKKILTFLLNPNF